MKRILATLILILSATLAINAQSVAEQARELYDKGDFEASIELLETEMKAQKGQGLESSDLYYNLGNSYYRLNELGKARLYYEKALLLDPSDNDTRHNIDYLTTKIEDKILVADTFFINSWFRAIQNLDSSNAWARAAIVCFILFVGSLGVFFFTKLITVKKISFYVGLVLAVFVIFANIFAFKQKAQVEERCSAVVMSAIARVHSSPDRNSKEVFALHIGTKIEIRKEDRSWLEIQLDDGSIGWIQRENIEII